MERPLLMIPGPIEVSPAVVAAVDGPPPGHLAPAFVEAMGRAITGLRGFFGGAEGTLPVIAAGSGTVAMDMAVANVVGPGDRALLVNTGYFSARLGEMLRRRRVEVVELEADCGECPEPAAVGTLLARGSFDALCATHVDTSTGVRVDVEALAGLAREAGTLSLFDGVCAAAAERVDMAAWGVDVYLTGSQKAVGLPAGLALVLASPAALSRRGGLAEPPPLSLDWQAWAPIMEAYEQGRPSYFSTPATNLVAGLDASLNELAAARWGGHEGRDAVFARHADVAAALRQVWAQLGLRMLPAREEITASTLSAILYPEGVGPELVKAIGAAGVVVAGGLYPGRQGDYFRVGHMGHSTTQPDHLERLVRAVATGLRECGHGADPDAAARTLHGALPH